ncbi:MAG: aminotransferase class V-fold PLP-dependent enzyme, partial [Verrucomicrobia bacterium]|nr:aminotransferase class V-fold PLP-dependent enzyme [Verrucomicrobiota bacterium]
MSEEDTKRLDDFYETLKSETGLFAGYPCNADFDYTPLYRFLEFPINNVGDPYLASNYHLNSHEFECEVLEVARELTHAPADDFWGYVTNGGTEGNMYGIFLARELYPEGIVYYSEDTHYSVNKVLRMLHIRNVMIRSNPDGTIDLDDLRESINIHRDTPVIVFANAGTTMKGAIDDLDGINEIFDELAIHSHYIHVDAALSGMILPFVDDPQPFDFRAHIN